MITFYDNDLSTCAQKVRIMLNERSASWNTEWLDLRAGEQNKPEYKKLNSKGVVPTIVHDGVAITESNNILYYLDELLDGKALLGNTLLARHRARAWLLDLDVDLHAAIGVLSVCIAFRHDYIERGPDAIARHLEGTSDPARRERWKQAIEMGTELPAFAVALDRWATTLDKMEATLAADPWLSGDTFGLIDVAYAPYVTRLDHLGILQLCAGEEAKKWFKRLQDRPSYQASITKVVSQKKIERLHEAATRERGRLVHLIEQRKSA
jgi:glutathione S-transferase